MKIKIITAYLLFSFASATAQSGNYFLSHYSPDEERFNIVCFDMVQDNRGVFYFATQAGILQFDGRNWDIIPTIGTVYSIAISESGKIYAAGSKGFGEIVLNDKGLEEFSMFHEQTDAEYIFQILIFSDRVYFLSDRNLFELNVASKKVSTISSTSETGSFIALNEIFDTVFISTDQSGLFRLEGEQLVAASIGLGEDVALISAYKYHNQYLLVTDDNALHLCSPGFTIRNIILQDSTYIKASVVINATWVNDELIAIGTLRGGVIFINPQSGKTEEIINYNTGLPDNEVFNLITDRNLNVWTAHAYGFTRISPYLPFRSFHYYSGLQGNLLCATTYQDKVYVGTSLGLYVLEKEEFYDEITYYVQVPVRKTISTNLQKSSPVPAESQAEPEPEVETKESQKGGLFRFLKKKKPGTKVEADEKQGDQKEESSSVDEETVSKTVTTYRREMRTTKILRSAYFSYKKVEGVEAKISQLSHWKGKLIASGLDGAFEVRGIQSHRITGSPIRFLLASETRERLIASTYDDRLLQFSFNKEWTSLGPVENINEPIHYIFEEGKTSVWFCGFDKVFRIEDSNENTGLERLNLSNSNFEKTIGLYINNEVIIATPAGFFHYNRNTRQLERGDTLRKPMAYFANAGNLWFRDKHSWYTAGKSGGHNNLQLLNLFSNLRFIDSDLKTGALWIITGNNELLQFNSEQVRQNEVVYPLILKAIRHEDIITARNYLKVEQDESAFIVEVVKPDYIGNRFIEYRYLLKELYNDWSDWSTQNNIIRFPYLPAGDYLLYVQARDIFGRVNEMAPVRLNIAPPYWKQPWFYAAEFSVFIFLVMLSFRLSYRYLIVSRLLSLLSIIMFIEFIQTAAGETFSQSSPVIDFSIQVLIAMLILPVEGFLRRHFLQALTKRNEERLRKSIHGKGKKVEYEPEVTEAS